VILSDTTKDVLALVCSKSADFLKDQLGHIQHVLEDLDPDNCKPCSSRAKGFMFDSIHFDIYNCFAEKVRHSKNLFLVAPLLNYCS
jgi:hypothetical protein